MTYDERIVKGLMYCSKFLRHHTEGKGSQRRVLFFLHTYGPMPQRDLLEKMDVRPGSLSELLSKLEAKGYIEKAKSDTDKRNLNVSITAEGSVAFAEMKAKHQAAMADLLSDLPQEDQKELAELLEKLRASWSKLADGSEPQCRHVHEHHHHE